MKCHRLLVFAVFLLIPYTVVSGQQTQYANPFVDKHPGEDCLDYYLNIVTLKDNNHRIYWKQYDCIRVRTFNNPFLFQYDIAFNEQLIPEDDPLSVLGAKFGLSVSSTNSNASAAHSDATKPQPAATANQQAATNQFESVKAEAKNIESQNPQLGKTFEQFTSEIRLSELDFEAGKYDSATNRLEQAKNTLSNSQDSTKAKNNNLAFMATKAQKDSAKSLEHSLTDLSQAIDKARPSVPAPSDFDRWKGAIDSLTTQANNIHANLADKRNKYAQYAATIPSQLTTLADQSVDLNAQPFIIRDRAVQVRKEAKQMLIALTDNNPDLKDFGSPNDEDAFVAFAKQAATLHGELVGYPPSVTTQAGVYLDQLHELGQRVVFDACTYKAFVDNDVSSINSGIISPIDAVLNDTLSFGYITATKRREGPWADPESVTVTVTRTGVSPFTSTVSDGKTPQNTTTKFDCSTDSTDLFEFGGKYTSFDDFFTDKPVTSKNLASDQAKTQEIKSLPNLYLRNHNGPQPAPTPKGQSTTSGGQPSPGGKTKSPSAPPADNTVLVQQWLFGRARLVVSGGLSTAFLRKQEFQRSSSISGSTSPTVIGLKTDTIYRNTPMLYGHVLLYSGRHDADAWYGTFGVTANSDNQGTDPEFLLGFSRSFAHQRFFLTAGAYMGERQKLDGGLMVGQTIPSTLTGDLPVTKSYHVGGAIGISFRLASTKNPQNNAPAKPAATPTKP